MKTDVQELLSRTRVEQEQKEEIRNREMAKSKPSASEVRQTMISKKVFLQFLDILPIR